MDQLWLGRQVLLVEDKNLAPVLLAESLEPLITKSSPSALMGQNQRADFPGLHVIHQRQKLFATEVHAPADFLDERDVGESACGTELFQRQPLVLQIRSLALAADAAISHDLPSPGWPEPLMSEGQDLVFGIIATACGRPFGRFEPILPIPTLDCLDVDPEQMGNLMTG